MKKIFLLTIFVACLLMTAIIPNLRAYDDNEDEEEFSPWAAWRKGFSYFEKGERSREKGKNSEALTAYRKAFQYYHSVKKARPNWNQQIIGNRIRMCEREIKKISKLLGTSSSQKTASSFEQTKTSDAELQNTKAELLNYKKKLFAALIELNELRQRNKQQKNNTEQIEDLMREKRIFSEEYKLLQEKFTNLQNQKTKPGVNEKRLRTQLVDTKIQKDILAQRLKLQQEKEKELTEEMAGLYRYKNQNKNSLKELKKTIENLEYNQKKGTKLQALENQKHQKIVSKVKSLETHNKQLAANLKEKEKEIEELDKWLKQLREKSGNQSEIQQEIMKANQITSKKYQELKKVNEKNVRELQQINSLLRENNVAEVQLKKTLREINNQRSSVEKEYKLLHKNYNQLLIVQSGSAKEIKILRGKQAKAEELVKSYSEKYKWAEKKLAARSNSDLQNISSLNKQIRELNKKIDKKLALNKNLKFELNSSKKKYKKLEVTFNSLKESSKDLKVNEKLLAQETQSAEILKKENIKLREANKLLETNNAKIIAEKRKEYQEKIKESEQKLIALQKKNQSMGDQNTKLNVAVNQITKLREELRHAGKTIQILRNVSSKKAVSTQKHTASITKYTPQITTHQTVDLKKLLADGTKAEKNDSEDLAIWNYRKYLTSKPDNIEVNHRLGSILYKRGQVKEAAQLLQKAYSRAPNDVDNASVYAQILIKQKKFTNASAILQKAIKKHPENYNLLTRYANAQAGVGQTTAALKNLAAAIKISPEIPQAYLARAQIIAIYHPDLLDTAAKSYRKARKLGAKPDVFLEEVLARKLVDNADDSEMIQFLQKPAQEAERGKDWVSAAWYFGQLHKLKPGNKEYREKFAAALLLQKKYKESLAALDVKNLSNNSRLIAASAELCSGNYSNADKYLENAKKISSMKVYFHAVKGYLKTVKTSKQKEEFKKTYTALNKLL
ncbi:MAG: tetratricopeptide repeat protein [Victivallaceae bacterium]|nr:tetratricopeptide repeat protein [Victivallaceae bacterium]